MHNKRLVAVICCLTAACGARPFGPVQTALGPSSQVSVVDAAVLPPPSGIDISGGTRTYVVGPFDTLVIDVFGIEELNQREIRADAAGRVSFPLAGTVDAAGYTLEELAQAIEARLRERHVRDPQVTVNLKETSSHVVTVDGQVREPGIYPVLGQMTLMRAIARAQGLGETPNTSEVVIFRTVQGQRMAALYDLGAIRRGVYDDPEVFANDIVIVGDNNARRLFRDFLQIAPLLTTPLIIAIQGNN